ncbi:MAG: ABC transporter ATP-binding protein/permease [Ruminococcus flavefaciens]|nr:ABC transporter ATP-binding protein/permease [Ruminococcus flavefaciens]
MFRVLKKFNSIFDARKKRNIILLSAMMLIGAILEMLSVSLVVPLITVLLDEQKFMANHYVQVVCHYFNIKDLNGFVLIVLVALIFIFLFKNIFLAIEYYFQYSFISKAKLDIQRSLMQSCLEMPYESFLYAKSGEIQRNILNDVNMSFSLLESVISFFTEGIVSIALGVTIFIVDPYMAGMLAIILMIMVIVIFKVVKPILVKASSRYQQQASICNTWIIQSVNGIKEIKITNTEKFFLENYVKAGREAVGAEKINSVLSSIPRLVIETFSVCGMLLVVVFFLLGGDSIKALIPHISAFAFAAVRLLPSVNRISVAMNAVAYKEPILDNMIKNLKNVNKVNSTGTIRLEGQCTFLDKVEMKNITYRYPNSEQYILKNASLSIKKGKSIGIVGTSGAGKTTSVDILLGLLKTEEGQILCDGIDIRNEYQQWLGMIGYIPQTIFMLDGTIRDNVAFGSGNLSDDKIMSVIDEAQLGEFIRSLPMGLDTEIGERGIRLSGGQRQRVGIARALYRNPEILVFDEATSSLDNETETAIMESINSFRGKKTLIIIAHRLSTIEECDEVYRVEDGKIKKEK